MSEMTPREIVSELDKHIIGQDNAKRSVAIALRNRWRRMQLNEELRHEVTPKNILLRSLQSKVALDEGSLWLLERLCSLRLPGRLHPGSGQRLQLRPGQGRIQLDRHPLRRAGPGHRPDGREPL